MCHTELAAGQAVDDTSLTPVDVPLADERMPALLAGPERAAPPLLLIPDMFGPSAFYRGLAARLAQDYEVLLVDYFFRTEPLAEQTVEAGFARRRQLDEVKTLADLGGALAWLRGRDGYAGKVGVMGFCMGGTFVLDLCAEHADLVAVAYYGFPVPQPFLAAPPPAPVDLAERMRGSILALWGDQDEAVGMEHVARFGELMEAAGADYEARIYAGVGHGFLSQATFAPDGESAADRSWAATLAHLSEHLAA